MPDVLSCLVCVICAVCVMIVSDLLHVIKGGFYCLTEMVQGPCLENQVHRQRK